MIQAALFPVTPADRAAANAAELRRAIDQLHRTAGVQGAGSIVAEHLAVGSVTAGAIAAGTITAELIAAGTITATQIAAGAIDATRIAANTITANEIAANAITTSELAADSVTSIKIAATTIVAGDIATGTITATQIAAGTVTATQIAADTITAGQIAANAITASELAAGSITAADMLANTITAGQIAANTITAGQLAASTITAGQIAAGTITATQIATGTLTGSLLAAATITGDRLVTGTITATQIAAGAITATELSANAVTAAKIAAGALDAFTITGGVIRSAASGQRWEGNTAGLFGYNAAGDITFAFDTATGKVTALAGIGGGNLLYQTAPTAADVAASPWWQANNAFETPETVVQWQGFNTWKLESVAAGLTYLYNLYTTGGTVPAAEGDEFTFSAYVRNTVAGWTPRATLIFYSAANASLLTVHGASPAVAADTWTRRTVTATAPANTAKVRVLLYPNGSTGATAAGEVSYVAGAQLERGALATAYSPRPDELLADVVGAAELADGMFSSEALVDQFFAAGVVHADRLVADSITAAQIAASAVTTVELLANTITAGDIATGTITATQIAAGTITATELAANSITAADMLAGTITATQIAASTITTTQIAANTIVAADIAAGTITATEIAAATITAAKIATGTITATQIAAGTITGDRLVAGTITGTQISATAIDGKTITGATVRTAASGARVELTTAGLRQYDAGGVAVVDIPTDGSAAELAGHVAAAGLDLLLDATGTPPDDRKLRWLDTDGAVGVEQQAYRTGGDYTEFKIEVAEGVGETVAFLKLGHQDGAASLSFDSQEAGEVTILSSATGGVATPQGLISQFVQSADLVDRRVKFGAVGVNFGGGLTGNVAINHGLGRTPAFLFALPIFDDRLLVSCGNATSTQFTMYLRDVTGTALGTRNVHWMAVG